MTDKRHIYRLPPCPSYDVEGMESWLTDMAEKGWILETDGIFAGVYSFVQEEKQCIRYRLDAASGSTSLWADNYGGPDEEAISLSEKYGWEYVATCRDFHIYRTSEPGVRELNTDPAVQAIALNMVRKRQRETIIENILWFLIEPLLFLRGNLLTAMVQFGTWFILFGAFVGLWMVADSFVRAVHLTKLRKKLQETGTIDHRKDWKKSAVWHHVHGAVKLVLVVTWVILLLNAFSSEILEEGEIPLAEYTGDLPFATMADLARSTGYDIGEYQITFTGMSNVKEWSDWLSPVNVRFDESAAVKLSDGSELSGGLSVDYHETVSPWIGERLAKEYYRLDKRGKHFRELAAPALDADYIAAYTDNVGFPTVVIQKGGLVIHATFYQTGDDRLELSQWIQVLYDSVESSFPGKASSP